MSAERPRLKALHLFAALATVALVGWLSSLTGPDSPAATGSLLWVVATALPLTLLWLGGAAGIGWLVGRLIFPSDASSRLLDVALGVSVMLWLDAVLGRLGVLGAAGGVPAWALTLGGVGALVWSWRPRDATRPVAPLHPIVWCAAPAAAVLLVASCSAPGWLWRSEFGGFDAMSYHLQLPREWLANGRITGLEHNVYSFLPGYVEAAYLHLAVLRRDPLQFVFAAQLLHASLAVLTALIGGRVVERLGGTSLGAGVTATLLLATPWIVVVGSLAYNELAVTLMLAAGMLAIVDGPKSRWRVGLTVGWLAGIACGAKLTAMGLAAAPLGILLLRETPVRRWMSVVAAAAIAGVLALLPYFAGNLVQTGNPVFPFAASLLGHGHWEAEQVQLWTQGHLAGVDWGDRITALWNQVLRYGVGPNPSAGEPWLPQWALLPWLAIAGVAVAGTAHRRWAVSLTLAVLVQVVFWLLLTHLQSRFLIPMAVPAAIAAGLGVTTILERARAGARAAAVVVVVTTLLGQTAATVWVFATEQQRAPAASIDAADMLAGDALSNADRVEMASRWPQVYVNHVLPSTARVLLVGEAAPLYYRLERIAYQTTWDRGPLSEAMADHPDDPAAVIESLRDRGFTHLLVRPEMLELWERSGWSDPNLTAERVLEIASAAAASRERFPGGIAIYDLPQNP